jgi:hypothetical protein
MTTGCTCGTAGCGGVAHEPGGRCPDCQTEAMPPGAARTVRQIIQAALYGSGITAGAVSGGRCAEKEAGA